MEQARIEHAPNGSLLRWRAGELYYWRDTFSDVFVLEIEYVILFQKKLFCFKYVTIACRERECYNRRAEYPVLLHRNVRRFALT